MSEPMNQHNGLYSDELVLDHTERLTRVETTIVTLSTELKSIRKWLAIGVLAMIAQGGTQLQNTASIVLKLVMGG